MAKKIHIVWANGRTIDIQLEHNPVAEYYYNCIKHLQHVDLEFDARKNPLYSQQTSQESIIQDLLTCANDVNLVIDQSRLADQTYLNELHVQYFDNAQQVKFDTQWLRVHDCIHLLEDLLGNGMIRTNIWFDYEDKAGPLIRPFDRSYLKYATTNITAGMCFLREHELGKNPALYQQHGEPLDIETICTQSKPWVLLKPVLNIALQDSDNYKNFDEVAFNNWFAPVRDAWCTHWSVLDWSPKEIFSGIPIGTVNNLPELAECFTRLDYPQRLAL